MLLGLLKRLADAWKAKFADRYDPAKHYMRGPGPMARRRQETQAEDLRRA